MRQWFNWEYSPSVLRTMLILLYSFWFILMLHRSNVKYEHLYNPSNVLNVPQSPRAYSLKKVTYQGQLNINLEYETVFYFKKHTHHSSQKNQTKHNSIVLLINKSSSYSAQYVYGGWSRLWYFCSFDWPRACGVNLRLAASPCCQLVADDSAVGDDLTETQFQVNFSLRRKEQCYHGYTRPPKRERQRSKTWETRENRCEVSRGLHCVDESQSVACFALTWWQFKTRTWLTHPSEISSLSVRSFHFLSCF